MKEQGAVRTNTYTKPKNAYQNIKNTFLHQRTEIMRIWKIEYRMEYKKNDRCWSKKGKTSFTSLYSFRTETTPRKVMFIDNAEQIYEDNFIFGEENSSGKRMKTY